MSEAGLFQITALAFSAFAALVVAAVSFAYPRLRLRVQLLPPRLRADVLAGLAGAPLLGSAALLTLSFLPSLLGTVWPGLDHCSHHHVGHPHLCVVHLPAGPGSPVGWVVAVGLVVAAIVLTVPWLRRLKRSQRLVAQVLATASYDSLHRLWVVAVDQPIAFATGIFRPRVLASRGLLNALEPELLTAVICHEEAHASRRDGLRRALAGLMSIAHVPSTRRQLLRDLDLAIEQACDDEAARSVGDRLTVAQALLAVRRLGTPRQRDAEMATLSIAGSSLDARIEALLTDPGAVSFRGWGAVLTAAIVFAGIAANPLHHLAETALGLLTG